MSNEGLSCVIGLRRGKRTQVGESIARMHRNYF
jgi:hypothetical protein